MIDLYYIVDGDRLINKRRVYSGDDTNVYKCRCHFSFNSPDWDSVSSKIAVFKSISFNITKVAVISSDGSCLVPWEITSKPGVILCSVSGTVGAEKIITNPVYVLLSKDFIAEDHDYGDTPTPSEFTQFVEDIIAHFDEYLDSRQLSYEILKDIPSIEGVDLLGDLDIGSFGFELASVADIDNMFD